jgi:hypothetical protein
MTRKTFTDLAALIASNLPDNTTGAITPSVLRTMFTDLLSAIVPSFAWVSIDAPLVQLAVGPSVVPLVCAFARNIDSSEFAVNAAAASVTRLNPGAQMITVTVQAECTTGHEVRLYVYKDGGATKGGAQFTGEGAGHIVHTTFSFYDENVSAAVYSLKVSCDTLNTDITFSNSVMIVKADSVK